MILKKLTTVGIATSIALATASFASANAPERPDLSEIITEFRSAQQELVQERRELAESLRDKTTEERRQAIEDYIAANEDRIALHKALSEQIREVVKNIADVERPERPEREQLSVADRPEVSTEVRDLMADFRATREALLQERLDVLASLKDATDEERAAALAALREQNAETAAQQREVAAQIRDAVQDIREGRRAD